MINLCRFITTSNSSHFVIGYYKKMTERQTDTALFIITVHRWMVNSTNKILALPQGSKIICCGVEWGHDPTRSAGSNQTVALSPMRSLKRQRGLMGGLNKECC